MWIDSNSGSEEHLSEALGSATGALENLPIAQSDRRQANRGGIEITIEVPIALLRRVVEEPTV